MTAVTDFIVLFNAIVIFISNLEAVNDYTIYCYKIFSGCIKFGFIFMYIYFFYLCVYYEYA